MGIEREGGSPSEKTVFGESEGEKSREEEYVDLEKKGFETEEEIEEKEKYEERKEKDRNLVKQLKEEIADLTREYNKRKKEIDSGKFGIIEKIRRKKELEKLNTEIEKKDKTRSDLMLQSGMEGL
jgi:uncharacterized protein YcbK (DUF882 family)